MDLKTFIATTLHEIVEGVALSQESVANLGGAVNPSGDLYQRLPSMIGATENGQQHIYSVSFDVAVTASNETGGEGGAKLQVASLLSIGEKGEHKVGEQTVSRVQTLVPLALPIEAATQAAKDLAKAEEERVRSRRSNNEASGPNGWMA